jgi:lysophospholipase L1-like esterase
LLPDLTVTPRYRDSPRRATLAAKTTEFNDALTRQARKHGVLVVDLYTKSRAEVPGNPALIAADGYHPSDLGYARWAELMWEVIEPTVAPR